MPVLGLFLPLNSDCQDSMHPTAQSQFVKVIQVYKKQSMSRKHS